MPLSALLHSLSHTIAISCPKVAFKCVMETLKAHQFNNCIHIHFMVRMITKVTWCSTLLNYYCHYAQGYNKKLIYERGGEVRRTSRACDKLLDCLLLINFISLVTPYCYY